MNDLSTAEVYRLQELERMYGRGVFNSTSPLWDEFIRLHDRWVKEVAARVDGGMFLDNTRAFTDGPEPRQ